MRLTIAEVVERLRSEGLVSPVQVDSLRSAVARAADDDMPWYMRAAVGIGAWAATGFLLAFLFGVRILENEWARLVFGLLLVAAALRVRRTAPTEFLRHAAVAASFAGQGLIIVSIAEMSDSPTMAGSVGLLISVAMVVLMPDRVHRFLSVLVGAGCAVAIALQLERARGLEIVAIGLILLTAFIWRSNLLDRDVATDEILEPVGYGSLVAAFAMLVVSAVTDGRISPLHSSTAGLGIATVVIVGLLLIALVASIVRENRIDLSSPSALIAIGAIVLLAVLTRSSPGIIAGLAVLVLGFDRRNPLLIGMGALFLTVFGSVYYYSLSLTLMEKAGVLAGSGALLLAVRALLAWQGSASRSAA